MKADPARPNQSLLAPYLLPYLLYTGIASIPGDSLEHEVSYGLRIIVTGAALLWAWRHYVPLRGPSNPATSMAIGTVAGLLGTGLWVALALPLADGAAVEPWSERAFWLRLCAEGTLVPVFEELLMRGYVLRLAVQWDRLRRAGTPDPFREALDRHSIAEVEPGAWTPLALAISTGLFALGHSPAEWPAALAYGLGMGGLWILRKDLLSCVAAHAATNIALACYVRATGQWALW